MHLLPPYCQNLSLAIQALTGMRHFHPFGMHLKAYGIALQVSFMLEMTNISSQYLLGSKCKHSHHVLVLVTAVLHAGL